MGSATARTSLATKSSHEGQPIVIDMGARCHGYCADMTRTIVLGKHDDTFPQHLRHRARRPRNRCPDGRAWHVRPRTPTSSHARSSPTPVTATSSATASDTESDCKSTRSRISALTSRDTLEAGMVITIEPGIYLPEWGGVRIEDMGLLDDDGFHSFTGTPKLRMLT